MDELIKDPIFSLFAGILGGWLISHYYYKRSIKDTNQSTEELRNSMLELKAENERLHKIQLENNKLQQKEIGSISENLALDDEIKSSTPSQLGEKIKKLISENKNEDALKYLIRADQVFKSEHYYKALVLGLLMNRDGKSSLKVSYELLQANPNNEIIKIYYADSLQLLGRLSESSTIINTITSNDAEILYYKNIIQANIYLKENDLKNAKNVIDNAIENPTDEGNLDFLKGQVYLRLANYVAAANYFKSAIAKGYSGIEGYKNCSVALRSVDNFEEANKILDLGIGKGTFYRRLILDKASVLYEQEKYYEAKLLLDQVKDLFLNDIHFSRVYLHCCYHSNLTNAAIEFHKQLDVDKLVQSGINIGENSKLWTLNELKAEYFRSLGDVYYKANNIPKAEETYKQALTYDSASSNTYMSLGILKFNHNTSLNFEESKHYTELAIKYNDKNFVALNNLGYIYVKLGDTDKATELFNKALLIDPNFQLAINNMKLIKK